MAKNKTIKRNLKAVPKTTPEVQPNVQIITMEQAVLRLIGNVQASVDALRAEVAEVKAALFQEE